MFGSDNNIVSDYEDLEIVVGQADVTSSLVFWDVSSSLIFGDVSSSLIFGDVASSLIFGDRKSESSLSFGEKDPPWYSGRGSSEVFGDWNHPSYLGIGTLQYNVDLDPLWYLGIGPEQETKNISKSILKNWEMSWVWPLLHIKADALFWDMRWQL